MENQPSRNWIRALAAFPLALLAVVVWALIGHKPHPAPPQLSRLPDFSLQERSGKKVDLSALKGKIWLADFIYIHCDGSCPAMTASMRRLQARWKDKGLFLVSVTVDPKRDTLDSLRQYADQAGADPGRWLFLRGPDKAVFDLAKGFKVTAARDRSDFIHSDRFILVGPGGWIRGYYDNTNESDMRKLQEDLGSLLAAKT